MLTICRPSDWGTDTAFVISRPPANCVGSVFTHTPSTSARIGRSCPVIFGEGSEVSAGDAGLESAAAEGCGGGAAAAEGCGGGAAAAEGCGGGAAAAEGCGDAGLECGTEEDVGSGGSGTCTLASERYSASVIGP